MLKNEDPFVPLLIERKRGETQLFAKEVTVEGRRYIVCRNEAGQRRILHPHKKGPRGCGAQGVRRRSFPEVHALRARGASWGSFFTPQEGGGSDVVKPKRNYHDPGRDAHASGAEILHPKS